MGSGRPQGRSPGCSLEGGGGRAPQALTRRHTGAVQRGGPLTGRRRSRRAARVSAAALRPFSRRGRRFARPLLAQPDPGGPSVGSGAGGRKGAAEPAAGLLRPWLSSVAGWRRRTRPRRRRGCPWSCAGERGAGAAWQETFTCPSFCYVPPEAAQCGAWGGSKSTRPSPQAPRAARVDRSANPLQPSARPLQGRRRTLVRKDPNSPVTTHTRARTDTHTRAATRGPRTWVRAPPSPQSNSRS